MFKMYFLFFLILGQLSCTKPTGSSKYGQFSARGTRTPIKNTNQFAGQIFRKQFNQSERAFQRLVDDYMSAAINPTKSNLGTVSGITNSKMTGVRFFGKINLNSDLTLTSGSITVAILDSLRNQNGGSFISTFSYKPKDGDHITRSSDGESTCIDSFRISFEDKNGSVTLGGIVLRNGVRGIAEYKNNTCYCNTHSCNYCQTVNPNYLSLRTWGDFFIPPVNLFNRTCI